MKGKLLSGKIARKVRQVAAFLLAVVLAATSVSFDALAAENPESTETADVSGGDAGSSDDGALNSGSSGSTSDRKIDVWDFGGVLEEDTDEYTNWIMKSFWDSLDGSDTELFKKKGEFKVDGAYTFGDLEMIHKSNDRIYYNNEDNTAPGNNSYGSLNSYKYDFGDGYTSLGAYYAGGSGSNGGKSNRCLKLSNVQAGDVVTVYEFVNNAAMDLHFLYLGDDGSQDDEVTVELETYTKGVYIAEYTGDYLIYMEGTGKPRYLRVVRTPGVMVSGTIDETALGDADYSVIFQDKATGKNFGADVAEDGSFSACVPANSTLTAIVQGVVGYGFSDVTKNVTTKEEAISGITLVSEKKDLLTLSGNVTGLADGFDKSQIKLVLSCPDASLLKDDIKVVPADDNSYSVTLEKGVEYVLSMSGANDYDLVEEFVVNGSENITKDIKIAAKPRYKVTGNFVGLAEDAQVADIKFTNLADDYEYVGVVTAAGYSAELRDGEYEISAAVEGYTMVGHVVVKGADAKKDLTYISTKVEPLEYVADIYVGCPDKANNYKTVRDAMKAVEAMRLNNASDKITIHIAPGLYREQIVVSAPNVSLVNTNPDEEVKITWYYGTGYKYYSSASPDTKIGTKGIYDENYVNDRYLKSKVEKWGAALWVKGSATDFYAENITFENSFTKYITEEELADGVEPTGESNLYDRTAANADATTKAANERSCATYIEGDKGVFNNCIILGGQDTMYTGKNARVYFKNCFLEGNCDYICGSGEFVFDNCELRLYGFSDAPYGPPITAASDNQKYGYVFRNCFITATPGNVVENASFGRPWRQTAMVSYQNCKLQYAKIIAPAGWTDMSGSTPEKANFKEYNTSIVTGESVDLSQRRCGVVTECPYPTSEDIINTVFSGWTPSCFVADTNDVKLATALTIKGTAKEGEVLTADFALNGNNEANNASVIQWYRVNGENETLVKASVAYADRTYTVAAEDAGSAIKVVVKPETVSGYTAAAVSATVTVGGEYVEPEKPEEPGVDVSKLYGTRTWKFDGTAASEDIEGTYSETSSHKDVYDWAGLNIDATASKYGVYFNSGSNCTQFETSVTIKVPAAGDYKLDMTGRFWGGATVTVNGVEAFATSSTVDDTVSVTGTVGEDNMLTIVTAGTGGIWMKDITLTCTAPSSGSEGEGKTEFDEIYNTYDPDRKIDVWDFGGVEEADTDKYTNWISKSFWDSLDSNDAELFKSKGCFKAKGEYTFGDLIMKHKDSDRIYYNNADNTAPGNNSYGKLNEYSHDFGDGYKSFGAYYAAGKGDNNGMDNRCLVLNNVKAGDVVTVYKYVNNATMDLHFLYLGEDGEQDDTVTIELETYTKAVYTAEHSGSYLIYMEGTGKPRYLRVVREPGVMVSGTIDDSALASNDYSVVLQDKATGKNFDVDVLADGSFKAFVPANSSLVAVLQGAVGYGFADTAKSVTTTDGEVKDIKLAIEKKALVALSGKVTGFAADFDKSNLKLTLSCPDETLLKDDIAVVPNDDWTYSVNVEKGVEYVLSMSGANDYYMSEDFVVKSDADLKKDIKIAAKPLYAVSGDFLGLAAGEAPASIKFTNLLDDYEYTGTVTATGYSANLRDGEYEISAAVTGYNMLGHVVVEGAAVKKNLWYVSTTATTEPKEYVADIYVGCPDKANNYETMRDAVAAIEAMRLTNETDKITVHIAPGLYREQVILSSPNVSFVNTNPEEEVKITWYYGTGYKYYSSGAKGIYDETYVHDRYLKTKVEKWGAALWIKGSATDFYAENITFENSFTKYITEEELADGVEPTGESNLYDRTAPDADATIKAANERSCATYIEGDKSVFNNCIILGGQDTMYTGKNARAYFKNCFLEGNTDYICGGGDYVFDNCEMRLYGFSDTSYGPTLTAAADGQTHGYLFRNCFITATPGRVIENCNLGRPWRQTAMVNYLNCKLQYASLISPAGWGDMSGAVAEKANFKEYNTSIVTGEKVDLSQRRTGVVTENPYPTADDIINTVFAGWTPSCFVADTKDVKVEKTLTIKGELKEGCVLTADFALNGDNEANNASVIQWYRVAADGTETLVKASVAYVDRTYTVDEKDAAAQIKVVVLPETVSGYKTDAVSATVKVDGEAMGTTDFVESNVADALKASGVTVEEVTAEAITDAYSKITDKTTKNNVAAGLKNAILDGVNAEELKAVMASDKDFAELVYAVDAMQPNKLETKTEAVADLFEEGAKFAAAGAKLNAADAATTVELVVTKDDKTTVDADKYENSVAMDITLTGVKDAANLSTSVRLTLPVPKDMSKEKLVVIHIHADKETVYSQNNGLTINEAENTVTITVDGFSTFVFANEKVDLGEDTDDEDEDDDSEEEDEEESKSISDAILSPKTFFREGSFIHSILWPETDSRQEAAAAEKTEAFAAQASEADTEDANAAAGALVQTTEKNGLGSMFAIIAVAAVAVIAASGVILFRKRDEES